MIWEHLYDEHDESTSNVVDVYIRYLRNKIDKGFDPPLILTRWGEGYMLRGDDAARTTATGRAEEGPAQSRPRQEVGGPARLAPVRPPSTTRP